MKVLKISFIVIAILLVLGMAIGLWKKSKVATIDPGTPVTDPGSEPTPTNPIKITEKMIQDMIKWIKTTTDEPYHSWYVKQAQDAAKAVAQYVSSLGVNPNTTLVAQFAASQTNQLEQSVRSYAISLLKLKGYTL